MIHVLTAAAAIVLAATGGVAAQSAKLEMNQVPPHVLAAARAADVLAAARAAGVLTDVTGAGIEVESGKVIFEVRGAGPGGRVREVDVFASGEIDEIEDEIQQADVPQSVMQALQRWLANFRPTKMERSERPVLGGNGATYLIYEFEGQHGGMEVDIEVSADGSRVVVVDNSRG